MRFLKATLQKLHTTKRRKTMERLYNGVKLLHDVARPHFKSNETVDDTAELGGLKCPPYSPDLAPLRF